MYPVSPAFRAALRRSHRMLARATVTDRAGEVTTLQVTGGSVTADATAANRRRCQVTLTDGTGRLTPAGATSLLAPYGNELRLERGLRLAAGDELVPLGVFGISETQVADTPGGLTITLTGYDRSKRVQRNRWTQPYTVAAGTNYADAIAAVLESRAPGGTYNFAPTSRVTPLLVFGLERDNDPWKDASSMAAAIGMELFFDAAGVRVLRPVPNLLTSPVADTYAPGEAKLLGVTRKLTAEAAYNGAVVTGEAADTAAPVRAEAWDRDPTSATYAGDPIGSSPFGARPYFLTSAFITTQAQAQDVADALLRSITYGAESLTFPAVVNPAHEPGDVVAVRRAASRVDGRYVLEQLTIPLTAGEQLQATARSKAL